MEQLLFILLQVAPESWLVNLPSTIGVASILGFFVYYFISDKKKTEEKTEQNIKAITDRYEAQVKALVDRYESNIKSQADKYESVIDKLRQEQNVERQIYRDRIDSLIDKIADITKQAIASMNANTSGIGELKDAINELRGKK